MMFLHDVLLRRGHPVSHVRPSRQSATATPDAVLEDLGALLDCSPLPVLATAGHSHTLQYVNPALRMLTAHAADATLGTPLVQDDADLAVLDRVYSTGNAELAVDLGRVF